jgi:hypothetical protein
MCVAIQYELKCGRSLAGAVERYVMGARHPWSRQLLNWYYAFDQGRDTAEILSQCQSTYRRHLLEVVERGLKGAPILSLLGELEQEIAEASRMELQDTINRIPMRMMIVMMALQLPAYLLVLLGPLVIRFTQGLNI